MLLAVALKRSFASRTLACFKSLVSGAGVKFTVRKIPGKGRGVISSQPITKGDLVEVCVCICVPTEEYTTHVRHTIFDSYLFNGHNGEHLLALGLGSLFNHSNQPNLDYHVDKMEKTVSFRASRDIASGEEITFYYGSSLWFDNEEPVNLTDTSLSHDHMDDEDLVLSSIAL